jgi:alpha-L-rhamnosidase
MIMMQRRKHRLLLAIRIASVFAALLGSAIGQQPDALRVGFHDPPAAAKTRCYWWWLNGNTTSDTITRDLEGMKAKGYQGAILVDADGSGRDQSLEVAVGPAIGSPQWMSLYVHALDVAQKLGLEISLNVTSRWDVGIAGGSTVTPEDAMKLLTFSRSHVEGGGSRTVRLATPQVVNGFYRPIATLAYPLRHSAPLPGAVGSSRAAIEDLASKTAARETPGSMPNSDQLMRDATSIPGEQDADVSEVADVTSHVDADGVLNWIFPKGEWEVLQTGYTDSPMKLTDHAGTPRGLAMDAMSARAFNDYWNQAVEPLVDAAKPYIGTSLRYLVTDSWEAGGTNWTEEFRAEFQRRRGYDPVPYLPIVAGRILTNRDVSNKFLFDLRRTVADLITVNYYDRFANYAKKLGLETHPESGGPHGAPIDALETFRSSAFPQTEFWAMSGFHRTTEEDRLFVKEASSAAHIYGKEIVAAEGLTSMELAAWSESPGRNLQPTFDHALTEGLNRLFWHEFTSSPAEFGMPGQEYFAGTHLNPNVTWWIQAAPLLRAFNRAQFLMQQGLPVSDLLYFYGDQVPGFARLKKDDPAHVLPGYDYDVTDEDALLNRMEFSGADLHTPEGLHYRALTLPSSRELSYAALQWVDRFVRQGGVVIGQKPVGPLGLIPSEKQAEYMRIANEMWAGCDRGAAESHYEQGRIYCTTESHSALGAMGATPDFTYRLNDENADKQNDPSFDFVHRRISGTDIYFVRNMRAKASAATLSFRVEGRTPEIWIPDDGSTTPALVYRETKDARTEIPLTFPPSGSVFLIFRRPAALHLVAVRQDSKEVFPSINPGAGLFSDDGSTFVVSTPGTYRIIDSHAGDRTFVIKPADLESRIDTQWTLSFPSGWGAPASIPVKRFHSWTQSDDTGVRYFSGTATYCGTMHISSELLASQKQLWMNLGQVREIASVKVNGIAVGTVWRAPFLTRIDRQLHPGENTVEIQVTNLWPNRIIGDLQPSAKAQYTHTNVRFYTKDSPLLPSGLLEPVTVQVGILKRLQ